MQSNESDASRFHMQSNEDEGSRLTNTDVALVWVEKAQSGSLTWPDDPTMFTYKCRKLRKQMKPLRTCVKFALLGMALFELPSYCNGSLDCMSSPDVPRINYPMLSPSVSNLIALMLWLYVASSLVIRFYSLGDAHHFGRWHQVGAAATLIAIVDCIKAACSPDHTGILPGESFRVSRILRPLIFLCFTKALRMTAGRCMRVVYHVSDVLFSLVLCLLFATWIVVLFFSYSEPFKDWGNALASLWILFTTANCPDVFIEVYEKNRFTFLFFFVFMVATLYLLSNILLSAIYDYYKEELVSMLKRFYHDRKVGLGKAFKYLAEGGEEISKDAWTKFFLRYWNGVDDTHSDEFNVQRAEKIFDALDVDNTKGIDPKEFQLVLDTLQSEDTYVPRAARPQNPISRFLAPLLTEGVYVCGTRIAWVHIEDGVIFVDVVLTFVQTIKFVDTGVDNEVSFDDDSRWFWILLGFSCFYFLEITLKLLVFGFERFWYSKPWRNRFDFCNVYSMFVATLICTQDWAPTWLYRQVVLQHILRSFRLLSYVEPLRFLVSFVVRLGPVYYRMGMMLFLVYYVYAMLGMEFFGGQVDKTNPRLKGTGYVDSNYWDFNFNDFTSSMVTLFVLMVVNNWFLIAGAFMKTCDSWWPVVFFVSFFVICNLVVLNILMALILDCSGTLREEMKQEDESGEESVRGPNIQYESLLRKVLMDDDDFKEEEDTKMLHQLSGPRQSYGAAEDALLSPLGPGQGRTRTTTMV